MSRYRAQRRCWSGPLAFLGGVWVWTWLSSWPCSTLRLKVQPAVKLQGRWTVLPSSSSSLCGWKPQFTVIILRRKWIHPERNSATDLASGASGSVSDLGSAEKLAVAESLKKRRHKMARRTKENIKIYPKITGKPLPSQPLTCPHSHQARLHVCLPTGFSLH